MTDTFVTRLADALGEVSRRAATGALRITADGRIRMAFFEDGALVFYASDLAEEALGPALVRPGRLDSPELRAAVASLERQASRGKALISLVLEAELADEGRVRRWLAEHAFEAFARVFDSREGAAKFTEGIRAHHALPFRVPVPTLLLEATRRMRNEWVIREAVGPLENTTAPSPDHAARLESLPLEFYDGLVASQVTRQMPLRDLIAISGLPEADALRALLGLRLGGVLDPFEPPKAQTNTGRLRMRQAAFESGVKVDADSAAVALTMARRADAPSGEEAGGAGNVGGAITLGELAGQARYVPPPSPVESEPAAVEAHDEAPRHRGNTAQLRLLSSAYKQMAEAEAASGNVAGAVQYYESALAQSPENLELLLGLASLLSGKLDRQAAAEKLLERACAAHPRAIAPRVERAKLMRASGRHTQADALLQEAHRIAPDDATVNALLARRDEKGGGFFSRLRGGNADRPDAAKPESFASAPRANLKQEPTTSDSGRLVARACRHCGSMVRSGATACSRCGATV
jgi:hypothetical protein